LPLTFSLNRTLLLQLPDQGHDMKCIILAGGFGTRISEDSPMKPEQMLQTAEYQGPGATISASAGPSLLDPCGPTRRAAWRTLA
jgi:hypothetical protein